MERNTRRDLLDHLLKVRAFREVLGRAIQDVLDHLLGDLSLSNPSFECRVMPFNQHPACGGIGRVEHVAQLPEAEAGLLAVHDRRNAGDVPLIVATPAAHPPSRGQEPHGFPMPQHVGGEAEVGGEFADRHFLASGTRIHGYLFLHALDFMFT